MHQRRGWKIEAKSCEVNNFLGKLYEEEELLSYWPFHENQEKPFKQKKVKFKPKATKLLRDIFVKESSKHFNWQNIYNLSKQFDVCDSDESLNVERTTDSKRFLN